MAQYVERTYRKRVSAGGLVSFQVVVKETDLWVSADRNLEKETRDLVLNYRNQLESYIKSHPAFLTTLQPYEQDPFAPPIVREMINATRKIGVGPMASVAGAIAEFVGRDLLKSAGQVIVENGGDIFLKAERAVTVAIFAGKSPLSEKIGLKIPVRDMPLGVCSSSGTVGHSHSEGIADAICIMSSSAILADGAATALGNRLKRKRDLERVDKWASEIGGIMGGVA
ncbi:MAG: UPF0280 family protein, partial [Deltaproteobacteria bacterium]|nr:UPF0280 family protein [Deltaproteobacteria bacterium]